MPGLLARVYVTPKPGILDPKHIRAIGMCPGTLFQLYLRWQTDERNGVGIVAYGRPVSYARICTALGIKQRTARKWHRRLERLGYVWTKRTFYNQMIVVDPADPSRDTMPMVGFESGPSRRRALTL